MAELLNRQTSETQGGLHVVGELDPKNFDSNGTYVVPDFVPKEWEKDSQPKVEVPDIYRTYWPDIRGNSGMTEAPPVTTMRSTLELK